MNVAYLLKSKQSVAFLYSDFTLRQALEKMRYYGYSAIPVITPEGKYYGTLSEGDFLWYLIDCLKSGVDINEKTLEETPLSSVKLNTKYRPLNITADPDTLIDVAMSQNFMPVVDDRGSFIGIVTRQSIIKRLRESLREKNDAEDS